MSVFTQAQGASRLARGSRRSARFDQASALLAAAVLLISWVAVPMSAEQAPTKLSEKAKTYSGKLPKLPGRGETMFAFYAGHPWYYRSDTRIVRHDDTDLLLKDMGWDGDAFYPPIDGGVRALRWNGNTGWMIDFLHNKAISRLGKGSHGRTISNPVIETVEAEGKLRGQPAPAQIKLTDLLERLEFTHGHNVLYATPMLRLSNFSTSVQPYFGIGAGVALPHTEVRFRNEKQYRTSEYQYGGPTVQVLAGLELRRGNASYFLEYKFTTAWITGLITGGDTTLANGLIFGDLWRQFRRWMSGEEPKFGRVETRLSSHQAFIGIGYYVQHANPAR